MKIDRLISIIMVLLERKIVSAPKLAQMFEVTPRTIYRDIETISLAGIPIMTTPGMNGGISIMEKYKVDKKLFTESDITALLMGLGSISPALSRQDIVSTLAKVKSLIPEEQVKAIELKSNQIVVDFTSWIGSRTLQPNLEIIKNALNENKQLLFQYSDGNFKKSNRQVEPYQLVLKEAKWYLQAYCLKRDDFRIFRLSRISNLQLLDSVFLPRESPPSGITCTSWVDDRLIMIKLLVDETLREQMIEYCGEENIVPHRDGKFIANMPFIPDEHGYRMLLSFADKCECLEPEFVRKGLIEQVEKLFNLYH